MLREPELERPQTRLAVCFRGNAQHLHGDGVPGQLGLALRVVGDGDGLVSQPGRLAPHRAPVQEPQRASDRRHRPGPGSQSVYHRIFIFALITPG